MKADISEHLGALRLFVNGEIMAPDAYFTYFMEHSRYPDFADAGYKLFSLPIFFSSKTMNENSQAPCFGKPIFDTDEPDWEEFDRLFNKVLEVCPDALIFPRMNISVNAAWERANPDELCDWGAVELHRPCFSSDKWLEEMKRTYAQAIEHVEASDYAEHVIGYMFVAGNTEEWYSHDNKGSIGKRSREKFAERCAERGIEQTEEEYFGFFSDIVAERICSLAKFTKEKAGKDKITGTFYGYTFETPWRESCQHSLSTVLECDEIDFLCAPISYASDRRLGRDHACLLPCDSLRAHGKLLFAENDTRTHLTRIPFPELPYFQNPVFRPRRYEDAVEMLKLHFCRAFLHGYAHWWFDMWGGCFNDPIYMSEMREFLEISKGAINKPMGSVSEIAVFIDEKCYKYCKNNHNGMSLAYHFRDVLGKIGTPYDVYLASDYELVKDKYKAIILIEIYPTELLDGIERDARSRGVGCYKVNMDNLAASTTEVFRKMCRDSGVHLYVESDAVVFANESYLFVHCEGTKLPEIKLPCKKVVKSLFESDATKPMHTRYISGLFELV